MRGWHVFPLLVGSKKPASARGFYDATLDLATIRTWWRWTPHNIGIATGPVSRLFVVDLDPGSDPQGLTPTVETGRGLQVWFETDLDLPSTAGRLEPHIDTRGTGGYVVAPPSIHPNGRAYRFCHQGEWPDGDPPILTNPPDWLIERLRKPRNSERAIQAAGVTLPQTGVRGVGYGQAALAYEVDALAAAPKGQRNDALNRAAFCLFQLVAGGEIAESEVVPALIGACERNGLMADDGWPAVHRTILSGATAGMQHPRGRAA
jgi:hypothetical protein